MQGPRAQADRKLYRAAMQAAIRATPNLEVIEAAVEDLIVENGARRRRRDGGRPRDPAGAVVLTTGTFLRGLIHMRRGARPRPAGIGEPPAHRPVGAASWRSACASAGSRPARRRGSTAAPSTGPASRCSRATTDPVPFSFLTERIANRADRLRRHHHHRGDARHHPRQPAPRAHVFRPDRGRRPALLPVHRGQGGALRRAAPRTRSSWSRRASTTTPSIPTASPPRCRPRCRRPSCAPFRAWRRWSSSGPATPSSTTTSTRASCCPTLEVKRAAAACSWPARSTAPPATRRPAPRASSPASTRR